MKFKAEFLVDNAAFRFWWRPAACVESCLVAEQLRRIADAVENGTTTGEVRKVVDTNGNTVGQWQFDDAEKEDIGQVLRDQSP